MPAKPTIFCMAITPFTADDRVDEDAYRAHLRRMVDAGVGVYLGSPGSGEGNALSLSELRRLYEVGVEVCHGKVPVHANPRETRTGAAMLEGVREAVAAGVDVVEIYALDGGHGFRPTPAEQERYYRDLLEKVDHPIALSAHTLAGFLPPVDLFRRLCEDYPQIVALHANTPIEYLMEVKEAVGSRLRYYTRLATLVEGLAVGASGAQAGEVNIIPRLSRSVVDHFVAGQMEACGESYQNVKRFSAIIGRWRNGMAAPLKMAMKILKLPGANDGRLRLPYLMPPQEELDEMAVAFDHLRLHELEGLSVS